VSASESGEQVEAQRARIALALALADGSIPEGVESGSEALEANQLLAELLAEFNLPAAQRRLPEDAGGRARKRAVATQNLPSNAGSAESWVGERARALPLLRECVQGVRSIRAALSSPPLPTGAWIDARRMAVVERWNRGIRDLRLSELAPLCDVCGLPVLLRKPERGGMLSTVCGDTCRGARKKRNARRAPPAKVTKKGRTKARRVSSKQ
jgi:hypothetical protein